MKSTTMLKLGFAAIALLSPACFSGDPTVDEESALAEPVGAAQEAINRFAMICIKNTTGQTIHYQIKWGDGPWVRYHVEGYSGAYRWHSNRYDVAGRAVSPTLLIRFDSDMTSGRSTVEYELTKYAAAEESCDLAKTYQFEWDGPSHRYIDLKSTN